MDSELDSLIFAITVNSQLELRLSTALGAISCRRCLGVAARSGKQCGRPALRSSQASFCQHHGEFKHIQNSVPPFKKSTRLVHGEETRSKRLLRSQDAAHLAHLICCLQVLGEADVKHRAGRPANGFNAITTLSGVHRYLSDRLHSEKAPRWHQRI
jgi:hypothetical protein